MSAMTDYLANKQLDHVLGTAAFTMPSGSYLGLFTSATSDAGGGTEVSGNGYARQDATWAAASGGAAANTSTHTYTAAGGDWGLLTHFAVFDALTGGNMLFHGPLTEERTVLDAGNIVFNPGSLNATQD